MLRLTDIKKDYPVADGYVNALKGVSISFRKNEFVSILGASGCGKTTLLNIIGGLDKYTSGDLIINGVSTKKFGDKDWDTYRNHSIGFIFQSYHLIPHQSVLQNVELALTISGISKEERRKRAVEALDKVGLKDRIHNKPNQLSGGQAQRVAIARALINDPEIVLADEPTGALDSVTSVQIMELLKEISKDRLVIMVTHNPELAEQYSTRIIRLKDGEVIDDSKPYSAEEEIAETSQKEEPKVNKGKKKSSMSVGMAFMLSLKNLLSKFKRTTMVAFAGSIGIIGVSMVLAISAGVSGYIDEMQNDMLSGYPLTVTETALDFEALMDMSADEKIDITKLKDGKIYVDSLLETLMRRGKSFTTNKIDDRYISYVDAMPKEYYNALQYGYGFNVANNIYTDFTVSGNGNVPEDLDVSGNYSVTAVRQIYTSILKTEPDYADYASMIATMGSFREIPDNYSYVLSQYDIVAAENGKTENLTESELKEIFESKDSLILVANDRQVTDLSLGQFGYLTQEEFLDFAYKALVENDMDDSGNYDEDLIKDVLDGIDYDFFVGENAKTFKWYPNDTVYTRTNSMLPEYSLGDMTVPAVFKYNHESTGFSQEGAFDMRVKVILKKKDSISYGSLSSGLYYTNALTEHMLETAAESDVVDYILKSENQQLFFLPYNYEFNYTKDDVYLKDKATGYIMNFDTDMMTMMMGGGNTSDDPFAQIHVTARMLGGDSLPKSVKIYPVDFKGKDAVTGYLDKWNDACNGDGSLIYTAADGTSVELTDLTEADIVKYNDAVGLIIFMVDTMIDMITIALIAFTALSLVVSTVMVGIITYVSVVERIKEIGILRAVGARKKDIKRLFNAETFIIGFAAGVVGIVVTYLLSLVINVIVGAIAGVYTIAALPVWQALIMIAVSVVLTLISGLIPAASAAKKDPVVALRTE